MAWIGKVSAVKLLSKGKSRHYFKFTINKTKNSETPTTQLTPYYDKSFHLVINFAMEIDEYYVGE